MTKHKKKVSYKGGHEKLAEDLGNLSYDALRDFLKLLSVKMDKDSDADADRGREKLSEILSKVAYCLRLAIFEVDNAWKICEPHMKSDPEAHAPLNAECEKCGKVYCDHENKY